MWWNSSQRSQRKTIGTQKGQRLKWHSNWKSTLLCPGLGLRGQAGGDVTAVLESSKSKYFDPDPSQNLQIEHDPGLVRTTGLSAQFQLFTQIRFSHYFSTTYVYMTSEGLMTKSQPSLMSSIRLWRAVSEARAVSRYAYIIVSLWTWNHQGRTKYSSNLKYTSHQVCWNTVDVFLPRPFNRGCIDAAILDIWSQKKPWPFLSTYVFACELVKSRLGKFTTKYILSKDARTGWHH